MTASSSIRQLLSFLGTVTGDLANVAGPPSFLAPSSLTEVPSCWAERPGLFAAATKEPDADRRALCVLKLVLAALRSQYYIAYDSKTGIKKPLNPFLGELFIAQWHDDEASTEMIVEQVSHHPPVSAAYIRDDAHGIRCQGYTRPIMTFNGNIVIKTIGHAILHIDKYDEDYLFAIADAKVRGLLSAHLYPELDGPYHIVSSSGWISEIQFSGRGVFSGLRNSFTAKIIHKDDPKKTPAFSLSGQWSDEFVITDGKSGEILERFNCATEPIASIDLPNIRDQDPWESRKAWANVISALRANDPSTAGKEKTKLEDAQRAMRREDNAARDWMPKFFIPLKAEDEKLDKLALMAGLHIEPVKTKGVWKWKGNDHDGQLRRPFYSDITPYGKV